MDPQARLKQIHQKIKALTFSDCSVYELFSFANQACALVHSLSSNQTNQEFLNKLKHTRDKEVKFLIDEEDSLLREERKQKFETAKDRLIQQLSYNLN